MATAAAEEIRVGERLVRVSSPDKPYSPERGLTKLDVVGGRTADELAPTELAVVAWAANLGRWPATTP